MRENAVGYVLLRFLAIFPLKNCRFLCKFAKTLSNNETRYYY